MINLDLAVARILTVAERSEDGLVTVVEAATIIREWRLLSQVAGSGAREDQAVRAAIDDLQTRVHGLAAAKAGKVSEKVSEALDRCHNYLHFETTKGRSDCGICDGGAAYATGCPASLKGQAPVAPMSLWRVLSQFLMRN